MFSGINQTLANAWHTLTATQPPSETTLNMVREIRTYTRQLDQGGRFSEFTRNRCQGADRRNSLTKIIKRGINSGADISATVDGRTVTELVLEHGEKITGPAGTIQFRSALNQLYFQSRVKDFHSAFQLLVEHGAGDIKAARAPFPAPNNVRARYYELEARHTNRKGIRVQDHFETSTADEVARISRVTRHLLS